MDGVPHGSALLGAGPSHASAATPVYVIHAVADPYRSADAAIDSWRHPIELAEFAQAKPGDTVVDLVPGSGYFTRIFSRIVGPEGHVYAVWPAEYARIDSDEVRAIRELARDPHYRNVTVFFQPAAMFEIPTRADVVWPRRISTTIFASSWARSTCGSSAA